MIGTIFFFFFHLSKLRIRGGSRTSSRGGHKVNDRAQSVREIFGHAHFCEDHAHVVAVNETNSPRCQWNPTFSSYKQVFSYIL